MRLALAFALLAGCGGAEAMVAHDAVSAPATPELGLYPGEAMTFDVHLAGVLVGEAQLAVGGIGMVEGRRAVVVRSRAATAGAAAIVKSISDESTTVVDVATGRPISVDSLTVMGDKRVTAGARFAPALVQVTFQRNDLPAQHITVEPRQQILYDAHTAMAQLRGWHAPPGALRQVWLVGGRRMWRVDVRYVGHATIGTLNGNREAVVFEGSSFKAQRTLVIDSTKPARTFRVWLSDDADRVPLKVSARTELGDIEMNLLEYARP